MVDGDGPACDLNDTSRKGNVTPSGCLGGIATLVGIVLFLISPSLSVPYFCAMGLLFFGTWALRKF
ncbi:hypothetical protein GMSM_29590 [Geomonas sp. Red276]